MDVRTSGIFKYKSPSTIGTAEFWTNLGDSDRLIGTQYDDWITGSKAAETLIGGEGNDSMNGGGGNDSVDGGGGNDGFYQDHAASYATFNGGAGFDTLIYTRDPQIGLGISVDYLAGTVTKYIDGKVVGMDVFTNVESIVGNWYPGVKDWIIYPMPDETCTPVTDHWEIGVPPCEKSIFGPPCTGEDDVVALPWLGSGEVIELPWSGEEEVIELPRSGEEEVIELPLLCEMEIYELIPGGLVNVEPNSGAGDFDEAPYSGALYGGQTGSEELDPACDCSLVWEQAASVDDAGVCVSNGCSPEDDFLPVIGLAPVSTDYIVI